MPRRKKPATSARRLPMVETEISFIEPPAPDEVETPEQNEQDRKLRKLFPAGANRLFSGDNLHIMRQLPSNSIHLIYIDSPSRDYFGCWASWSRRP